MIACPLIEYSEDLSRTLGDSPVFDFLTRRKAAESGTIPIPQTEHLPAPFRRQVERILCETIGEQSSRSPHDQNFPANNSWIIIHDAVAQEHGLPYLGHNQTIQMVGCLEYLLNSKTDQALDLIGVALQFIERTIGSNELLYQHLTQATRTPMEAIQEFNERCQQHGVGYVYDAGRLMLSSSAYVHSQIVNPALTLVADGHFRGSQTEFLRAHEDLRAGKYEAAMVAAGRAFESTMKTICSLKDWTFAPESQVKHLVPLLFEKGLIPQFMQDHFNNLKAILISVGTPRNKDAAHGREYVAVNPPKELAEFSINLTAVAIVFLVSRYRAN